MIISATDLYKNKNDYGVLVVLSIRIALVNRKLI